MISPRAHLAGNSEPIEFVPTSRLLLIVCVLGIALPALYIAVCVQYSAITLPFWDHVEIGRMIVAYHDGHFTLRDLARPHNHSRPLTINVIYLLNAILTDWDIRSEYVYVYLAIFGGFVLHLWGLRRMSIQRNHALIGAACLSIIYFSPAGNNNHWWSFMLQLDLGNVFIVAALLSVSLAPRSWTANIIAVACCWLSTFTITNGFMALSASALTVQLAQPRCLKPSRFTAFWIVNLAGIACCYFPVAEQGGGPHPGILACLRFVVAYLGTPLGALLYFPYRSFTDLPNDLALNTACGAAILAAAGILTYRFRKFLHTPGFRMFIATSGFAIASAFVTAWGRAAFDQFGVANANASRYTIYSSYMLYGFLYLFASEGARSFIKSSRSTWLRIAAHATLWLFCLCASISYARGVTVYRSAHQFDKTLAAAFGPSGEPTSADHFVYPVPEVVTRFRADLLRLGIGPYRSLRREERSESLTGSPAYLRPLAISLEQTLVQVFSPSYPGLRSCRVEFVTWDNTQRPYTIRWRLVDTGGTLAQGTFSSIEVRDWSTYDLSFAPIADSKGRTFSLILSGDANAAGGKLIGVPLFRRPDQSPLQAVKEAVAANEEVVANVTLLY